jgi:hypothetical protein
MPGRITDIGRSYGMEVILKKLRRWESQGNHTKYILIFGPNIFAVSIVWSNQQMRQGSSVIYWCSPNLTPTTRVFQQVIAIIRGSYLPQKLHKQYLCCGCMWVTVRPVWSVVEGCDQECTVGSVLAVTYIHNTDIDWAASEVNTTPWWWQWIAESWWGKKTLEYINKSYYYLDAVVGYFKRYI